MPIKQIAKNKSSKTHQVLYTYNCKTWLRKKIIHGKIPCHGRLNAKTAILPKLISRFNALPFIILAAVFAKLNKLILKWIWKS